MRQRTEVRKVSGASSPNEPALDACYGQIGISAIAAAVRYQGLGKNAAYAPAPTDWRAWFVEEPA